jgi:RNA polymerase sigma-70 factor (ECF subfamily)
MDPNSGEVTRLLRLYRAGDREAEARLFQHLYVELHRLAAYYLAGERPGHTLRPTALVNEAYLRLADQREKEWADRSHFVAVAATIMRQVLVDFARRSKAMKRDFGIAPEPLHEGIADAGKDLVQLLDLDAALTKLASYDERQARIVELRYIGGLSIEETAGLLGISARTVKREWTLARTWLHGELTKLTEASEDD